MVKQLRYTYSLVVFFITIQAFSQCSMVEIPLLQRIQQSNYIFEGKVISKKSFWNNQHTLIFTSNIIEVYKIFMGNNSNINKVELITEGGTIGNKMHTVEPSLQLNEGETGVFFAEQSSIIHQESSFPVSIQFQAYGSVQGYIKYNFVDATASDVFKKYNDIDAEIYNIIEKETGHQPAVVKAFDIIAMAAQSKQLSSVQAIISFSPSTITAGTGSILTIDGSGFGSTQGTSVVQFKNADDGGATYIQPALWHYVSWNDSQIKVKVPAKTTSSGSAGTGTIQVIVGSNTYTSSSPLTITYNELNLISGSVVYQTDHVDMNSSGGYTWEMYTGFDSNIPAKDAFMRAFATWRCGTYINWQVGNTTSVNTVGNDGTNVIRFDTGGELPVGVLGRCSSFWSSCGTGVWYVEELDIAFDDATTWNYLTSLPSGSESDFESVALHELGHGHQLGHVINSNDVMHYALTVGTTRRLLNQDDIDAGNDVMSRNVIDNSCGPTHMIALTPGNCAVGSPTADFTASATNSCDVPLAVNFTDMSTGGPTSWAWDIDNNGSVDYTTQSPSHTYSSAGTYTVKLAVTNTNGSDTLIKTGYITVGSASLPFMEDFENSTFPSAGWFVTESPVDAITWGRDTTAGGNGTSTACATMNFYNYSINSGAKDNLISKSVSLGGITTATMTFKVAYKNYPNSGNYDSLRVFISTDCGLSYGTAVKTLGGTSLATSGSSSNEFTPGSPSDWRTETIPLNSFVGNNIVVKFEGTNYYGNNLYIDDINITGTTGNLPIADFSASDSTICVGDCIDFTDQSTGTPTSWEWSFSGAATTSSTVQSPAAVCYTTTGTHSVQLIATNGTGADTIIKTTFITVNPLPSTPTINQAGNVLTSSVTAASYQWYLDGVPVSGATSVSYTAIAPGNYTVMITDANGCTATSGVLNFVSTGIENSNNTVDVKIYPNPFGTRASIEIKGLAGITGELLIYDLPGKEVFRTPLAGPLSEIQRGNLADGIYLYKVYNKNQLIGKGKIAIK